MALFWNPCSKWWLEPNQELWLQEVINNFFKEIFDWFHFKTLSSLHVCVISAPNFFTFFTLCWFIYFLFSFNLQRHWKVFFTINGKRLCWKWVRYTCHLIKRLCLCISFHYICDCYDMTVMISFNSTFYFIIEFETRHRMWNQNTRKINS